MSSVARKYAKILTNIIDEKSREDFGSILTNFSEIINYNKQLKQLLESPIVTAADKIILLEKITKTSKLKLPELFFKLIRLLLKTNNIKILPEIAEDFRQKIISQKGLTEVSLIFAAQPTNEQLNIINEMLIKEFHIKPDTKVEVDEDIIAGFIITFDSKRIDASLGTSLNNLENQLKIKTNLY